MMAASCRHGAWRRTVASCVRRKMHPRVLLFPLLAPLSLPIHADTLTGTVISVADGDTNTVLDTNHEAA